jgi:hypothetical protein
VAATVLGALRQFLPKFLQSAPSLSPEQRRALWAINHCRTPALGGRAFACATPGCSRQTHFAWHSCNHKACPQCGRAATAQWVQRELGKLVNAPYFLVTFTLPAQLRSCFFGPHAKEAYDLFFAAVAAALSEKLAGKDLRAAISGFTAVLHTWNQQLGFHPHIHCLVPGAGLNARGRFVRVRNPEFLVHLTALQGAFRHHLLRLLKEHGWQFDPQVWDKQWGVHIRAAGNGICALKYLGAYVARSAISDGRVADVTWRNVTIRWKDRDAGNRIETRVLEGVEFVRRYLLHVLPRGLRSVRYYGFCHPAAKANRLRVQLHSGGRVQLGANHLPAPPPPALPMCPCCQQPMRLVRRIASPYPKRGPPTAMSSSRLLRA